MQAGRKTHAIAALVHQGQVAGVARVVGVPLQVNVHWTIQDLHARDKTLGHAGAQLQRSFLRIDQFAPRSRVILREKARVRDLDNVHVAQVLVTIGKRQLHGLRRNVYVIGAVVLQSLEIVALQEVQRE